MSACRHERLRFTDAGLRLVCDDEIEPSKNGKPAKKCGLSWVQETRPGSYMANVGAQSNVLVEAPFDKRQSPGVV